MSHSNSCSYSIANICDFFHAIEKKHDLLAWQVDGVYLWPLVRMRLYYRLTQDVGLYEEATKVRHSAVHSLKMLLLLLVCFLFRNPFLSAARKYVLIPHSRKVNGRDIYSDQLMGELGDDALVIDSPYYGSALTGSKTMDPFILMGAFYASLRLRVFKYRFDAKASGVIDAVEEDIFEAFGVRAPLKRIMAYEIVKFKFLTSLYEALFKAKKTEKLFIVVAYLYPFITAAAQRLNIPIVELQHGTVTPYHLGYSYKGSPAVPYQADELLCFGRFWYESTALAAGMVPRVIGAPYIDSIRSKGGVKRAEKSIFFSSQNVIAKPLFAFAYETAALMPDYRITYNLHPNDKPDWFRAELERLGELDNFTISYRPPDIFEMIAAHEYQAGVFSTTLLEGMTLGTKVILVDLPGQEYMIPVLDRGDAIFVRSAQELLETIQTAQQAKDCDIYYAPPVATILQQ